MVKNWRKTGFKSGGKGEVKVERGNLKLKFKI